MADTKIPWKQQPTFPWNPPAPPFDMGAIDPFRSKISRNLFPWTPPSSTTAPPTSVTATPTITNELITPDILQAQGRIVGKEPTTGVIVVEYKGKFYNLEDATEVGQSFVSNAFTNTQEKNGQGTSQWDSAMAKNQEAVAQWNARNANQNTDLQRRANELEFENRREQILGTLDPQNQWVSFYRTYSAPNPYQPTYESPGMRQEQAQGALTQAQASGTPAEVTNWQTNLAQSNADVQNSGAEGNRGITTPNPNPNTPNWLPQFVSGQVVGQPIKNLSVTPTSGQQWANTPISQQKGLQDYMKYMGGQSYEDYLSNLEMSLPNTKGGGSRWQPARQRRV